VDGVRCWEYWGPQGSSRERRAHRARRRDMTRGAEEPVDACGGESRVLARA
jgi:hypothetical protein